MDSVWGKGNPSHRAVAEGREKEEDEMALSMRRIFSVLAVMAIMAAMVAASAMPAFAQGRSATAPNCKEGTSTAIGSNGIDNRNFQADESLSKNFFTKCIDREELPI